MVVNSALVSYAGATSTISAAMRLIPSRPRMMVRSSRVVHPPVSGVPVAGATTDISAPQSPSQDCIHTRWVQCVDVDRQVHGLLRPDPVPDLLDDAISANLVNLPRLHNLKAAVAVVLVIRGPGQGGSDTGVDVSVVGE